MLTLFLALLPIAIIADILGFSHFAISVAEIARLILFIYMATLLANMMMHFIRITTFAKSHSKHFHSHKSKHTEKFMLPFTTHTKR